jgi:hypothetical protein
MILPASHQRQLNGNEPVTRAYSFGQVLVQSIMGRFEFDVLLVLAEPLPEQHHDHKSSSLTSYTQPVRIPLFLILYT